MQERSNRVRIEGWQERFLIPLKKQLERLTGTKLECGITLTGGCLPEVLSDTGTFSTLGTTTISDLAHFTDV